MNVALDLRLVDTRTQEIVDVISYQKQIIGREVSLGVFDFLNGNTFDLSAGNSGQEPVQLAVRALVERAVLEYAEAMTETQPTVTDDLVESLLSQLGEAGVLELTAVIAFANFTTRANVALGIESDGFADACGLKPLAQPSSTPPVAVGS